jgi:cytochrome c-type biogenesis protein CcmH
MKTFLDKIKKHPIFPGCILIALLLFIAKSLETKPLTPLRFRLWAPSIMPTLFRACIALLFLYLPIQLKADDADRYQQLTAELRCLVCQNESLADSDAPLANDLRQIIHVQLTQGKSNEQIINFLTTRYGEFVLFKPTLSKKNILLWLGPFIILIIAAVFFIASMKLHRKKLNPIKELSVEEKNQLEQMLK